MRMRVTELKESNELLNLLMENMNSAVFMADADVKLLDFNNTLQKLFSKPEQDILNQRCGNAIGCAFAVEEQALCGEASHCPNCVLRSCLLKALNDDAPTLRKKLHRRFYVGDKPLDKHFQFSVQPITHNDEPMAMVVMDDLSEIENQRLSLVEKQRRLDEDLSAAAGIQQSLLPDEFPAFANCSFGSKFVPSAFVGGDIYNVFRLDDHRLVIYMIDVSGHGVASALVALSVSQMFHPTTGLFGASRARLSTDKASVLGSPSGVLDMLDRHYPFERFDTYFTMSYLVLNCETGDLLYSNAGHPFPVVIQADGTLKLLEDGGCIIGLAGMVPFDEGRTRLHTGDRLVVYTDGVTEYLDPSGNLFGEDRLHRCVVDLRKHAPQVMLDALYGEMMAFGKNTPPADDISVLALEFTGPTQNSTHS